MFDCNNNKFCYKDYSLRNMIVLLDISCKYKQISKYKIKLFK